MMLPLFMAVALMAIASGQSISIGTDCECNVSVEATSAIHALGSSHGSGECTRESADPLDVWKGIGVEFKGGADTFDYRIDCVKPCKISRVDLAGSAWCGGDTRLSLWDGDRSTKLAELDTDVSDSSGYYEFHVTADPDYAYSYRVVETGDTCSTWRCRSTLNITAEVDPAYKDPAYDGDHCDAFPIDDFLTKCSSEHAQYGADIHALQSASNVTNDAIQALQDDITNLKANQTSVDSDFAARLQALEEWKETILTISDAHSVPNVADFGRDFGALNPSASVVPTNSKDLLILFLAVTNVVVMVGGCIAYSRTKGNAQYGGVYCSGNE
jgi:hypothetical protein